MTLYEEVFQWIEACLKANEHTHGSLLLPAYIMKDHIPLSLEKRITNAVSTNNRGLPVCLVSFSTVSMIHLVTLQRGCTTHYQCNSKSLPSESASCRIPVKLPISPLTLGLYPYAILSSHERKLLQYIAPVPGNPFPCKSPYLCTNTFVYSDTVDTLWE